MKAYSSNLTISILNQLVMIQRVSSSNSTSEMLYIDISKFTFTDFTRNLFFMILTDFRDLSSSIDQFSQIDGGLDPDASMRFGLISTS